MIKLLIEDYCDKCPDFEADVDKEPLFKDSVIIDMCTTITCEHAAKCKWLKKEEKK